MPNVIFKMLTCNWRYIELWHGEIRVYWKVPSHGKYSFPMARTFSYFFFLLCFQKENKGLNILWLKACEIEIAKCHAYLFQIRSQLTVSVWVPMRYCINTFSSYSSLHHLFRYDSALLRTVNTQPLDCGALNYQGALLLGTSWITNQLWVDPL